ncbi:MAG: hypothetical protein KatS3mg094_615 [Candidatus Parcubacteria bacterium]|nr:MAG: hypothetical protein KatS3mg094_615 [Candidatus Parcubacteria bacterium]
MDGNFNLEKLHEEALIVNEEVNKRAWKGPQDSLSKIAEEIIKNLENLEKEKSQDQISLLKVKPIFGLPTEIKEDFYKFYEAVDNLDNNKIKYYEEIKENFFNKLIKLDEIIKKGNGELIKKKKQIEILQESLFKFDPFSFIFKHHKYFDFDKEFSVLKNFSSLTSHKFKFIFLKNYRNQINQEIEKKIEEYRKQEIEIKKNLVEEFNKTKQDILEFIQNIQKNLNNLSIFLSNPEKEIISFLTATLPIALAIKEFGLKNYSQLVEVFNSLKDNYEILKDNHKLIIDSLDELNCRITSIFEDGSRVINSFLKDCLEHDIGLSVIFNMLTTYRKGFNIPMVYGETELKQSNLSNLSSEEINKIFGFPLSLGRIYEIMGYPTEEELNDFEIKIKEIRNKFSKILDLPEESLLKNLLSKINKIRKKLEIFRDFETNLRQSLLTHATFWQGFLKILEERKLASQTSQQETGKEPTKGPTILVRGGAINTGVEQYKPGLWFGINGVEPYGAFVFIFPTAFVIRGKKFVILPSTKADREGRFLEMGVYSEGYSLESPKGIEISINDSLILCPQLLETEVRDELKKIGYNDEWISEHIVFYEISEYYIDKIWSCIPIPIEDLSHKKYTDEEKIEKIKQVLMCSDQKEYIEMGGNKINGILAEIASGVLKTLIEENRIRIPYLRDGELGVDGPASFTTEQHEDFYLFSFGNLE